MRKHFAVVTLLLLFAVCAFGQERSEGMQKGAFRVFAFGSDLGYTESDLSGSNLHGGLGLGLEYQFSDRWSGELSVTREKNATWTVGVIGADGAYEARNFEIVAHPVDAVAQYHFFTENAWKPFVGIGARYVSSTGPGAPYEYEKTRLAPQLTAGFYYNITRRLGLRVDMKRLLSSDSTFYDDSRKLSVGVGWKF